MRRKSHGGVKSSIAHVERIGLYISKHKIINLGHSNMFFVFIIKINCHWAEGAAEFDDFGADDQVCQAGCQEPDVHIGGGHFGFRPGKGQKSKGAAESATVISIPPWKESNIPS